MTGNDDVIVQLIGIQRNFEFKRSCLQGLIIDHLPNSTNLIRVHVRDLFIASEANDFKL